ncbi:hypothetical protein [Variovorax sp. V15]|uniref:hypothetical protein n=1 Tax=Variovorax sp. V15 TaxID=3065952 RepID=UPI0034E8EE1E
MAIDHDPRKTQAQQSREVLAEVVALGVAQGLFTVARTVGEEAGSSWRFVEVLTPDGLAFDLKAGSWNKESAISASVGGIKKDGLKVYLSDTARRKQEVSASCSFTRGSAAILKDLTRRVLAHPDGIAGAQAVRTRWETLVAQRQRLRGHIAALSALGYTFRELPADETYSARAWGPSGTEPRDLTVYENGRVTFEGSCDVSHFAGVIAVMREAPPEP